MSWLEFKNSINCIFFNLSSTRTFDWVQNTLCSFHSWCLSSFLCSVVMIGNLSTCAFARHILKGKWGIFLLRSSTERSQYQRGLWRELIWPKDIAKRFNFVCQYKYLFEPEWEKSWHNLRFSWSNIQYEAICLPHYGDCSRRGLVSRVRFVDLITWMTYLQLIYT